jgi:hypothetical protein
LRMHQLYTFYLLSIHVVKAGLSTGARFFSKMAPDVRVQ